MFPPCQIRLDTTVAIDLSKFHRTLSHLPRGETLLPSCLEASSRRGFAVTTTIDLHAADARARVCVCVHTSPTKSPLLSSLLSYVQSVIVVPPRCFSRRLQCDLSGNWDGKRRGKREGWIGVETGSTNERNESSSTRRQRLDEKEREGKIITRDSICKWTTTKLL